MRDVSLSGSENELALAGLDGAGDPVAAAVSVSFGPERSADIVFSRSGATTEVISTGGRVVATGSGATWRRAPWPVRDAIFDLPLAADPGAVLVVGSSDNTDVDAAVAEAENTGASPRRVDELTSADLETSATVVFVRRSEEPFPPAAFAVVAAGRLLLMSPVLRGFGLLDGIDHLGSADAGALGRWAGDAARHPSAFDEIRAWGRLAAERHRASLVYPRLVADFRAGL